MGGGEPMRRKDREVTDRKWMDDVLAKALFIEVAMSDGEGRPYIVPMGFGYEDGVIYLHGASEGLKNDILRDNPLVCFQTFIDAEVIRPQVGFSYTMHYKSVTGHGRVTTITDPDEQNRALKVVTEHYGGAHSDTEWRSMAKFWIAKIEIESMTGKSNPGIAARG